MSKNIGSGRKNRYRSDMTRRLFSQYIFSNIVMALGIGTFVLLSRWLCGAFIWHSTDPVYRLLIFVEDNIGIFMGAAVIAGWIIITYIFIYRLFGYLDEVSQGARKISESASEPIVLSPQISYIENELNTARQNILDNERAAKEAESRKNDLVVYLAHDLKTPLTSVIGYLTLLRDENQISEELREKYLSISLEKAERLEDLINEFFEITRFNLSEITIEYRRVNLTRMLEQLTYEFRPMFMEKNLSCELDITPDTVIRCDIDKMQRVFDNLLRNAVNYSFEGGKIKITGIQQEKNIHLIFENQGDTISAEKLERIFQQFYRLDTSRSSKSGGAGLGLAIAKEIVEHHGGTITADSFDETIRFDIILPSM